MKYVVGLLPVLLFGFYLAPASPPRSIPTVTARVLPEQFDISTARQPADRPNIILFIADDWSYPHAGVYGDPVIQTPNFDRLARGGMLFTNAYTASPSCSPSRASILTGRYPHQNGVLANLWSDFPANTFTYTAALEEAGYLVGKDQKGWGPGDYTSNGYEHNPAGKDYGDITNLLDEKADGQPFCYWFGSQDPHRTYLPNLGAWSGLEADSVRVPAFFPDLPCVRNDLLDYYAEVERFDRHVGEVVELLESRGELDNTLIVVTSDNGMPFPRSKANLYDAGTRMPFVAHWPARIPAATVRTSYVNLASLAATFLEAAGVTTDEPTDATGPTLPSLLGELIDPAAPGRAEVLLERERHAQVRAGDLSYPVRGLRTDSFLYLRNFFPDRWPAGDPEAVLSVGAYGDVDNSITKMLILDRRRPDGDTTDHFRLAFAKRPPEELYDLHKDPQQLTNLATAEEYATTLTDYASRLDAFMQSTHDPRASDPQSTFWDKTRYTPTYGKRSYDLREFIDEYRYAREERHTHHTLTPCE